MESSEQSNSNEQITNILSDSGGSSNGDGESPWPSYQTSPMPSNSSIEEAANVLCTHDGVLLKKASAEHIAELNSSGSLSLVEYGQSKRLCIEWKPNENILVAADTQDQGDWSLVDTISRRKRTISECKVFNTKPMDTSTGSLRLRPVRSYLEDLSVIEVRQRRQTIRLIRKEIGALHTEFFFQHGNADQFLSSLKKLHITDLALSGREAEEYVILTPETRKLKKTFAELDIGEIKASSLGNEGWLPNRVVGLLASLPDYMAHKTPPRARPCINESKERKISSTSSDYHHVGISESKNTSGLRSLDKSPDMDSSELENVKEIDEKIVLPLPERKPVVRGLPLNENQWLDFQTSDGRILDPTPILQIIFKGGIEPKLRPEVWKYLLNYYKWNDTEVERVARRKQKYKEYYTMKAQWLSMTSIQEKNFMGYHERKCQIEKDVWRTDRSLKYFEGEDNLNLLKLNGILMTYVMYNFDIGYVQGMSDLLAPILAIMENESDAFWCFVGFMDMVPTNFEATHDGMQSQFDQLCLLMEFSNPRLFKHIIKTNSDDMLICYRWLLIWYRREFSHDDVPILWECLWTKLPCPNFHLFISLAILDKETDIIIERKYDRDRIIQHIIQLSGNIDLMTTLETAEAIYYQIKEAEYIPNEIRAIIGEPLMEIDEKEGDNSSEEFDNNFDDFVKEPTEEETKRNQELLEEACQRSMFLQYF